jgi:leader peptidase (prepilin peptidase) / N-methyltransferase
VDLILAIPLAIRLVVLFVVGTLAGALINWAIYQLAYNARALSPWSAPAADAPPRRAIDRVPLVGWLGLRRESRLHGRAFWVRPLLVELIAGLAFAALYLWQTRHAPAFVAVAGAPRPPADFLTDNLPLVAHARYLGHVLLISLMLAASLIDLDEKTIPDSITVPGTLIGLALAVAYPWSLPAAGGFVVAGKMHVAFLTLAAPELWPGRLGGLPLLTGLAVGLGCWTLWCGGLLPRYWNTRRGWGIAARVFFHRLRVERLTYAIGYMCLFGAVAIALAAWTAADAHWAALLSALVGMAAGGGIVWAVRFVGAAALGREAMGFGDVTLMSMIGAFLGWQACLIIFFLAPFLGLVFAIVGWLVHRQREIPYGPFLCAAALVVILRWAALWHRGSDVFALGWIVPAVVAVSMVLLGVLLLIYRLIGQLLTRSG